jgi:large exoprotein involved in heme utilization and adhesion
VNHLYRSYAYFILAKIRKPERTPGHFIIKALATSLMLSFGINAYSLPTGGKVSAGSANISGDSTGLIITQATANAVINWQSFGIAQGEAVQFVQPTSSSVALNRVVGSDPSNILGNLSAISQW